jgi:uncharacterized membrane protein
VVVRESWRTVFLDKTISRIMLVVLLICMLSVMSSSPARAPVASGLVNDGTKGAPDQRPDVYEPSIKSSASSIRLGIWLPRYAGDLPPYTDLNSAGIKAIDVTVLDETTLSNFDVVYIGRGGFWVHAGVGTIDPQAIKDWVSSGGGILGESEAVIYDSVSTLKNQWSPQLSEILGVWSSEADSNDFYVGDGNTTITITDPSHPITEGLPESFSTRVYSAEVYAYVDIGLNPTAKKIFNVTTVLWSGGVPFDIPVIAAEYGFGKAVYFPYCPDGYTDWASPGGQNLKMLFINAVKWAAGTSTVGGYSIPIQVSTRTEPVLPYIALIATLTTIFTELKPKTKRKR